MFVGSLSVCTMVSFSGPLASNFKEPLKCVSLNNQPRHARPTLININSDETLFYPLTCQIFRV